MTHYDHQQKISSLIVRDNIFVSCLALIKEKQVNQLQTMCMSNLHSIIKNDARFALNNDKNSDVDYLSLREKQMPDMTHLIFNIW